MVPINSIEKTIGYEFNNKDLLQQAFVRRSYSEEKGGQNNEVLEFIGDKALDLVVVRIMMERFGVITEDKDYDEFKLRNPKHFQTKYGEGKFTDIKKDLVKKNALANTMDSLGFHNYLIMGNGDFKQNRQNDASVKEDLFEAIIGAVALDSNWDMNALTEAVENMINFDAYFENNLEDSQNYIGLVQEWFLAKEGDLPRYRNLKGTDCTVGEFPNNTIDNGKGIFKCQLKHNNICFNGYGNNNSEAREKCAERFYHWLEDNGYITDPIIEAIGEPNENESIRQLNELYQKKLITKPVYTFKKCYGSDGCVEWECDCYIEENGKSFCNYASSKKEAQRMSAYNSLLELIGEYEENVE